MPWSIVYLEWFLFWLLFHSAGDCKRGETGIRDDVIICVFFSISSKNSFYKDNKTRGEVPQHFFFFLFCSRPFRLRLRLVRNRRHMLKNAYKATTKFVSLGFSCISRKVYSCVLRFLGYYVVALYLGVIQVSKRQQEKVEHWFKAWCCPHSIFQSFRPRIRMCPLDSSPGRRYSIFPHVD